MMRTVAAILTMLGWLFGLAGGSVSLWMAIRVSLDAESNWSLFWLSWVMIVLSWMALSTIGQSDTHPGIASAELLVSGIFSFALLVFQLAESHWLWSATPWPLAFFCGVPLIAAGALMAVVAGRVRAADVWRRRLAME